MSAEVDRPRPPSRAPVPPSTPPRPAHPPRVNDPPPPGAAAASGGEARPAAEGGETTSVAPTTAPPETATKPVTLPRGSYPPPTGDTTDPSGPETFRLRPIRAEQPRIPPLRTLCAAICLVLGVGLLGGTAAGTFLTGDARAGPTSKQAAFAEARELWHTVPVNTLFPRTVRGDNAGPGGADRRWIRLAVAPDSTCQHAFDPLLAKALAPVGCRRLVRATYADETSSSVITVGIVFTKADRTAMRRLSERFSREQLGKRTDLMPRPYAPRGTVAADFGDAQRASWTIRVLTDAPAVVYAVSGFADGRAIREPRPAAEATGEDANSAIAQAGLGHAAQGLADRTERVLHARVPEVESAS